MTAFVRSKRRKQWLLPALLGLAALPAEVALACEYNPPPRERVARRYEAVVIVTVASAAYVGDASGPERAWQARGTLSRTVSGTAGGTTWTFGRHGIVTACDDGMGPPRAGDLWVLYLSRRDGSLQAVESYPLSLARTTDPRFGARARSRRR